MEHLQRAIASLRQQLSEAQQAASAADASGDARVAAVRRGRDAQAASPCTIHIRVSTVVRSGSEGCTTLRVSWQYAVAPPPRHTRITRPPCARAQAAYDVVEEISAALARQKQRLADVQAGGAGAVQHGDAGSMAGRVVTDPFRQPGSGGSNGNGSGSGGSRSGGGSGGGSGGMGAQ